MTVLDVSNWDAPTFDAACLRANGVERVIIGCWDYEATTTILARARAAGIVVEDLYCFMYFGLGHEQREVANALAVSRAQGGIRRVWVDVEADRSNEREGVTVAERVEAVRRAVMDARAAGLEPGIYTGAYYWPSQMGDTAEFAELPLWVANYGTNDPAAPRSPIREVDFGGWSTVAVHQYSSAIVLCGRRRDHNYWFLEEDAMTPDERARLERLERLLGANGIDLELDGQVVTGETALAEADRRGWSAFLGIGQAKQGVAEHGHEAAGNGSGSVYGDIASALSQASKAVEAAGRARK